MRTVRTADEEEHVDPIKAAKVVEQALEKAVEKVADLITPPAPGRPGSVSPPVDRKSVV